MKAAKLGEEILIEAKTVKKGRTLAFLECEIRSAPCSPSLCSLLSFSLLSYSLLSLLPAPDVSPVQEQGDWCCGGQGQPHQVHRWLRGAQTVTL